MIPDIDFSWVDEHIKALKAKEYMTDSEKNAIKFAYGTFKEEEFLKRVYKFIEDSIALERECIYRRVQFLTDLNENIRKVIDQLNKDK